MKFGDRDKEIEAWWRRDQDAFADRAWNWTFQQVPVAVERVAIAVADSIMTFYIAREASKVLIN